MAASDKPIIIIGAGIVGLTLAQGLKKHGFAFKIYDRDSSIDERPAGWGITLHWALPALQACLTPELFSKIPSIQVNPDATTGMMIYPTKTSHSYDHGQVKLTRGNRREQLQIPGFVHWQGHDQRHIRPSLPVEPEASSRAAQHSHRCELGP